MPPTIKPLILLALLACAACAKPSDISESRREHILAGPHGWIDITLHAPTPAASTASAPAGAEWVVPLEGRKASAGSQPRKVSATCDLQFLVDGEQMVGESVDLRQPDAAGNAMGWRFPVPAGALKTEVDIDSCGPAGVQATLDVAQVKDQLSLLEFDGKALTLKSTRAYAPATLDTVHGDVGQLHERGEATDGTLATLTRLVIASVVLNLVVLAALLLRRKR